MSNSNTPEITNFWKPTKGDEQTFLITKDNELDGYNNKYYIGLTKKEGELGIPNHAVLRNKMAEANIKNNDIIKVKYIGDKNSVNGRTYKDYTLEKVADDYIIRDFKQSTISNEDVKLFTHIKGIFEREPEITREALIAELQLLE